MTATSTANIEVPVLIVGGGAAGLSASIMLSRLGVESLLVTRYPQTTNLPRGHVLNQRTMEIFADMGVAGDIIAQSTPPENMRGIGFFTALGGAGSENGHARRLGFIEGWGGGYSDPDYIAASAFASANLSLLRSEPLLKRHAETYPTAELRFHHELVDVGQDDAGVTATIVDHDSEQTYTVRSQYLLGADAGRTVANLVGMSMGGVQKFRKLVSMYVETDLSEHLPEEADDAFLIWVFNPDYPEHIQHGAVLVPQGPTQWGNRSEEWFIALSRPDVDATDIPKMVQWAREALGIPDFDPKVLGVSEWFLETALADDFRQGRVFLLGDAAHKLPPSGGLGMNSAVQDVYNLCWKLAMVIDGVAGERLLDTYNSERRPVNAANIQTAVNGVSGQEHMASCLGVSTDMSAEENWAALRLFWDDLPGAQERRHEFTQWLGTRTAEYHQHNIDFGYTYESAAVIGDGTPAPEPIDAVRIYQPGTRPGHPLPHAFVERAGERVALRSLTHDGHFALIAGEDGHAWVEAATAVAQRLGIPLRAARVGHGAVDYVDMRMAWTKQREISREGAVLVRPDGYIAYRSSGSVDDPDAVLSSVLTQMLAID
jgi:2,4-dichlorophenol 6-monooxygenase